MVDDTARDRAIYHALKAVDEVAAALQTHLIEEHGADPERGAPLGPSTNSLKLLRQAREHLGMGLRAVEADHIADSDVVSLLYRCTSGHDASLRARRQALIDVGERSGYVKITYVCLFHLEGSS